MPSTIAYEEDIQKRLQEARAEQACKEGLSWDNIQRLDRDGGSSLPGQDDFLAKSISVFTNISHRKLLNKRKQQCL